MQLLEDARRHVREGLDKGVTCPCCGQLAKRYRRWIHAEVAIFLIKLVKAYRKDPRYYHAKELIDAKGKHSTDASYTQHWGLVTKANAEADGRKGGFYKPTQRGIDFVLGRIAVPAHAVIYDNRVEEWATNNVSIRDSLGKKFKYEELMVES